MVFIGGLLASGRRPSFHQTAAGYRTLFTPKTGPWRPRKLSAIHRVRPLIGLIQWMGVHDWRLRPWLRLRSAIRRGGVDRHCRVAVDGVFGVFQLANFAV